MESLKGLLLREVETFGLPIPDTDRGDVGVLTRVLLGLLA